MLFSWRERERAEHADAEGFDRRALHQLGGEVSREGKSTVELEGWPRARVEGTVNSCEWWARVEFT